MAQRQARLLQLKARQAALTNQNLAVLRQKEAESR